MSRGRRRKPFKLKLKKTTIYTFSTVVLLTMAGLIALSFSRQGPFLSKLYYLLVYYFGWGRVFLPFLFLVSGFMLSRLRWSFTRPNVFVGSSLLLASLMSLTQSGLIGFEIWQSLTALITGIGAFLVLLGSAFIGFVITFNTSLEEMVIKFGQILSWLKTLFSTMKGLVFKPKLATINKVQIPVKEKEIRIAREIKKGEISKTDTEAGEPVSMNLPFKGKIWEYPPISLLSDSISGKADRGDIKKDAETIEKTLESFGISARVAEVNLGPAVTQYALEIALGTKLSKITALSTDLALALAAPTGQIRIEAPIPGRSLVGVEVPNRSLEVVSLKRMLNSEKMKKTKSKLTVALGLNVSGDPIVTDIGRMPHILIAGATGSGKSVCIHSFIVTILFRTTPEEVKLILVDPKRVELTQYNSLPHLLTPVIVDPKKVLSALKWAISEMDRRYKLFAEVGVRNLDSYNELSGIVSLPYILIIIDELADIMLFSPADVEDAICRIAQMARATGIHLIVSTQRPSVDIITGLIKANIPCRIAFNVSSQIDSRVIIDGPGAEKLLGRGDMLFVPPDQAKPTRIQGAYLSDVEIQRIIEFFKQAGVSAEYSEEVTEIPAGEILRTDGGGLEDKDELLDEAAVLIRKFNRASSSFLQRRLRVGYARAARIVDQLERAGMVGPGEGAKPREINLKVVDEYLAKQVGATPSSGIDLG